MWNLHGTHAQEGDLAQLTGLSHKHFIVTLKAGQKLETHRGVIAYDDLIGKEWGSQFFSHTGSPFFLLQPSLAEILREIKRNTQIMYPKDISFTLITMGIGEGQHVLEAGTGSGALTTALAFAVGSTGHVTTYEQRDEMQKVAKKNLALFDLDNRVTFKSRDIAEGFDETGIDALFLDVSNPYNYIIQARKSLKPGGFFGSILPTAPQVSRLLYALKQNDFAFIDVVEILMRYYKPDPDRFRPTDRMVAHTGYLIFARPVIFLNRTGGGEVGEG